MAASSGRTARERLSSNFRLRRQTRRRTMSDGNIPVSTGQEIETKKVNINKLFTDFWFRVPEYQRSYKWGPEQIDDLLDDIQHAQRTAKDKEYFLGSVVLQKYLRASGKLTYFCYDVLDGQQ